MIGRRCTGGDVLSRAILIAQTLSGESIPKKNKTKPYRRQGRGLGQATTPWTFTVVRECAVEDEKPVKLPKGSFLTISRRP